MLPENKVRPRGASIQVAGVFLQCTLLRQLAWHHPLHRCPAAWPGSASLTLLALPACFAAALGAGGATTYEALRRADAAWCDLRTRRVWGPRPEFVRTTGQKLEAAPEVDVAVCGGTLGIFLACSLQQRGENGCNCCGACLGVPFIMLAAVMFTLCGPAPNLPCSSLMPAVMALPPYAFPSVACAGLRVAVLERGPLQGRAQEWNISRKELVELVGETCQEPCPPYPVCARPVAIVLQASPLPHAAALSTCWLTAN
jgi:hypothetical protein